MASTAPASAGPATIESAEGALVPLLAGPAGPTTFVPPAASLGEVSTESSNIFVNYTNFTPEAQAAFQSAVDLWEPLFDSTVTIEIDAEFAPLGPGVLGSAGPRTIHRSTGGCLPVDATWYPAALANALCGVDLNPTNPFDNDIETDAEAIFNSDFGQWYFPTDVEPIVSRYDFVTVVMHELGHALGFLGSMDGSGPVGRWGFASSPPTNPMIYDRFAANGSGQPLVGGPFPNNSQALKAQLTSQNVVFNGASTVAAASGPAQLYAPLTWSGGSSFSHLDETEYPRDDLNSLMTPILGGGEVIQDPGPIVLAMFEDMRAVPGVPSAPTNLAATAGSNAAKIEFGAASTTGIPITKYTVVASPGGAVGEGLNSPVWVAGLENGTPYTFTVKATNALGDGPVAGPTAPSVTPQLHGFHPVDPVRILDTRFGQSAACLTCQPLVGALPPGSETPIDVVTNSNMPDNPVPLDADTAVLNVTVTDPTSAGWLTVWDDGPVPTAANLNFVAGQTVPNLVTVKLAPDGSVMIGNTNGAASGPTIHVVIDVVGWYDEGVINTGGVPYQAVTPTRILDTRTSCATCLPNVGALAPESQTTLDLAGQGAVDLSAADAVVMNVTATAPTKAGWLTLWPEGSVPNAANLNFVTGQTVPNLVTVKLSPSGTVELGNTIGGANSGTVHVVIDVVGWYGATATGGGLNAATPERILDTRFGVFGANSRNTPLAPQEQAIIQVSGFGRVPPTGVAAVVMNVTAVTPSAYGWFTVWPASTIPNAANLNYQAGQTVPNLVIVGLGVSPSGTVKLGNTVGCPCAGSTHAVFDVSGWFAPDPTP